MGAKLTKSKTVSISEKTKEQQKETTATVEKTNNHLDTTINDDNKRTEKKTKKKKEEKSNKKSSKTRVDKSTNTENCVLSSPPFTEQLVGDQTSTMNNKVSSHTNAAQVNAAYQSETSNKDVQELRDACVHNGFISTGYHVNNEQENQANNLAVAEQFTSNTLEIIVGNPNQVHSEEQQFIKS